MRVATQFQSRPACPCQDGKHQQRVACLSTWRGWDCSMSISSLPSVAAVVPGPAHVTMSLISRWFCQLLPFHPSPQSTAGGSHVHACALKCCSTLCYCGLQHHPVFSCDNLFFLVLMTPPGLVSSAGLQNHAFLLVGHPGGNQVKAVLKASCSAKSPSFLCAPPSPPASSVPVNLVVNPTGRWEQLDWWTLSEAEPGAGSKMWESLSIFWQCWKTGLLLGEHHKGKVILLWKKSSGPLEQKYRR